MNGINLSAFFVGAATMYFAMWAVNILSTPRRTRQQTILGWIMAIWAIACLKDIVITFPQFYIESVLNYIFIIDGWSAIAYTIIIFELTSVGWTTWRRVLALSVPWALFTVLYVLWPTSEVLYAYMAFLWCYAWTVVIIAYFKVRRYLRYIRDNYSNIDDIDISWIKVVFWFCIVSQLAWLVASLQYNAYADAFYYVSDIVMWQMVIHYSRNYHPIVIENTPMDNAPLPKRGYPFADILDKVVEEQQLYLNGDLTLDDLAKVLNTNRTYLSNYFNTVKGQSFYFYINGLRIERKAVPMIQQHPEFTLEYIAAESGFKSISTFRRAFQRHKGMSPGQYRIEIM